MNYTKTIRAYCKKNEGTILDSKQIANDYFSMVPYKTFMKILNRLEDEGILSPVSKGVYLIASSVSENANPNMAILDQYTGELRGMIIGYSMYNDLGISSHKEETIEIITRMVPNRSHKNIGKYHLTGADILFTDRIRKLIRTLELIEAGNSIQDMDFLKYNEVRSAGFLVYSDAEFDEISKSIRYQYSTVITLDMLLKGTGRAKTHCIDIFQKNDIEK